MSDEIRLAAITKLAPDIWMGAYDTDIEAEANELCTKVGNRRLAYEWYIRMFKGSSSYYEMAKARFYLTKREEFLRVNQNAQGFRVFSEYYLDLAEDYASCSLIDKAKELIAEYVLPQADDDMLRVRIVTAYGNFGAIHLALKTVANMVDPYDRGQALANVACLAKSTSVKSDPRMHRAIFTRSFNPPRTHGSPPEAQRRVGFFTAFVILSRYAGEGSVRRVGQTPRPFWR